MMESFHSVMMPKLGPLTLERHEILEPGAKVYWERLIHFDEMVKKDTINS